MYTLYLYIQGSVLVQGKVLIDGKLQNKQSLQRIIGYVSQEDYLLPWVTAREAGDYCIAYYHSYYTIPLIHILYLRYYFYLIFYFLY